MTWIWEKIIDIGRDGIKYHLKFETLELFRIWNLGVREQEGLIQLSCPVSKEKTKFFVWYFTSEERKQEFIKTFKNCLTRQKEKELTHQKDSYTISKPGHYMKYDEMYLYHK